MLPFLQPGDQILVSKLHKIKIGDICALQNPESHRAIKYLIKKIVRENNKKYYVEGVNKKESRDSRNFGWIEKKMIIGKMIAKL